MKAPLRACCQALGVLLVLCIAPACSAYNRSLVEPRGDFGATPAGPSAVVQVTAASQASPKTRDMLWGSIPTPRADRSLADILAHAAREDGGMDVMLPHEAARRLEDAGLKPTLQPAPEELRERVRALGCTSYLTVELKQWRYNYVYFASYATIQCRVECRRAADDGLLWEAEVLREARGISDREVARLALAEMFRALKKQRSPTPP